MTLIFTIWTMFSYSEGTLPSDLDWECEWGYGKLCGVAVRSLPRDNWRIPPAMRRSHQSSIPSYRRARNLKVSADLAREKVAHLAVAGNRRTRIVRDGVSLEVHRDTRGARLEPGDEIHLGRAIVTFVV
jgi:hypothetical protein